MFRFLNLFLDVLEELVTLNLVYLSVHHFHVQLDLGSPGSSTDRGGKGCESCSDENPEEDQKRAGQRGSRAAWGHIDYC